jgi:hypothetical protein
MPAVVPLGVVICRFHRLSAEVIWGIVSMTIRKVRRIKPGRILSFVLFPQLYDARHIFKDLQQPTYF